MTFKWILPALVAVSAGILAFGVTQRVAWRTDHPKLDDLRDITFLARTLDLREEQAREIETLRRELQVRLMDCCSRYCAARRRLGEAMAHEELTDERIDEGLREMCRAHEESERAVLEHIQSVRELLDADQRQRFNAMIEQALCRACPECGTGMAHYGNKH